MCFPFVTYSVTFGCLFLCMWPFFASFSSRTSPWWPILYTYLLWWPILYMYCPLMLFCDSWFPVLYIHLLLVRYSLHMSIFCLIPKYFNLVTYSVNIPCLGNLSCFSWFFFCVFTSPWWNILYMRPLFASFLHVLSLCDLFCTHTFTGWPILYTYLSFITDSLHIYTSFWFPFLDIHPPCWDNFYMWVFFASYAHVLQLGDLFCTHISPWWPILWLFVHSPPLWWDILYTENFFPSFVTLGCLFSSFTSHGKIFSTFCSNTSVNIPPLGYLYFVQIPPLSDLFCAVISPWFDILYMWAFFAS